MNKESNFDAMKNNQEREIIDVYYEAFFVDSVETLKNQFPPVHSNHFYHHMTVAFRPQQLTFPIGQHHEIKAIGRLTNNKVDVLLVEAPDGVTKNNPHITLSTAEGVEPVESNNALENEPEKIIYFEQPVIISTTTGYYDKQLEQEITTKNQTQ